MFYLTATICAISNSFNYPENYINVTFTPTPKHLKKMNMTGLVLNKYHKVNKK